MKVLKSYALAVPVINGGNMALVAVLVEDAAGQYAVYVGLVGDDDKLADKLSRDEINHWVARRGAKQSFTGAGYYFQGLDANLYRR